MTTDQTDNADGGEADIRILYLEDDPKDVQLIQAQLDRDKFACDLIQARDREQFEAALASNSLDLILCDYSLPAFDGRKALRLAAKQRPDVPVIVVTGVLNDEEAVECLHNGATDYLLKTSLQRLVPAVRRALQDAGERRRRRAVEAALRESERRFHELAQNSTDVFWFFATNPERTLYVSPAAENVWNTSVSALETNPRAWMESIHPEDQERMRTAFDQWQTGHALHFEEECRFLRPDSNVKWVSNSGTLIRDDSGKILRLSGVSRDITDRKRADEADAIRRRQEEQLRNFEQTLARYQRLSSSGSPATVTRDLAGMVPVKQGSPTIFSQLCEDYRCLLDEYLDQLITVAPKPTDRMRKIINQIGRLEGGPRDLLDVHLEALSRAVRDSHESRSRAYTAEGRLLAIQMMGFLADYYRIGLGSVPSTETSILKRQ